MGVGVGWCGSLPGLSSRFVSGCLRFSPFVVGVGVGWCGSLPGLSSRFVPGCLPLCVGVGAGWCGSLPGLSSRRVSRCLRLSPFMWGWVLVGVVAFLASEVVLSPVVFGCLPLCGDGCWFVW